MTTNSAELVNYIQEHCLWQFFSRAWDREENLKFVHIMLLQILSGETVNAETPADRCHFANANHLARELRQELPWVDELSRDDLARALDEAFARLTEIAVTQSKNGELRMQAY